MQRTPLSKQRNKHLQTTLIESAKMAPRYSPTLAVLYDREKQQGNANRATLAVARKLVAYLVAVDRGKTHFLVADREVAPRRAKVFFSASLPGLAVNPTGRESKLPTLPSISFETGRKTQTQSWWTVKLLCYPMEVWFSFVKNRGREANTALQRKESYTTLLPSASGELLPS
jgi:hypothetical protein